MNSAYLMPEPPPYWVSQHGRIRHREVNRVLAGLRGAAYVIALAETGDVLWYREDGQRLGFLYRGEPGLGFDELKARYPNLRVRVVQAGGYSRPVLPDALLLRIARGLERPGLFPFALARHRQKVADLRDYVEWLEADLENITGPA